MQTLNRNCSVWRGDNTPPSTYHIWIKPEGAIYLYIDDNWVNYKDILPIVNYNQNGFMISSDKIKIDNLEKKILELETKINELEEVETPVLMTTITGELKQN
jgi:hypothetical protein